MYAWPGTRNRQARAWLYLAEQRSFQVFRVKDAEEKVMTLFSPLVASFALFLF
jgi:hypothetical protein